MPRFSCSVLLPWLLAGLLLGSVPAVADELVKPYDFTPGAPASANQVNSNFDALFDRVNALQQTLDELQQRVDALSPENSVEVLFTTNYGNFSVALDAARAPVTVANFLAYVDAGFYDGTVFHRVLEDFVAQGGGFDINLNGRATNPPIVNEALNGLHNVRGTLAMARTDEIDSATSQFFINLVDNRALDPLIILTSGSTLYGYAVFGRVVSGMEVVDLIGQVPTDADGLPDSPVVVTSVTRL
jgi:cyclophilin family peptidyl-prolyl cis-trans isomerase